MNTFQNFQKWTKIRFLMFQLEVKIKNFKVDILVTHESLFNKSCGQGIDLLPCQKLARLDETRSSYKAKRPVRNKVDTLYVCYNLDI